MNTSWVIIALLSAVFAALTEIFAKLGVKDINSNLATAIRTVVIYIRLGCCFYSGRFY